MRQRRGGQEQGLSCGERAHHRSASKGPAPWAAGPGKASQRRREERSRRVIGRRAEGKKSQSGKVLWNKGETEWTDEGGPEKAGREGGPEEGQ